MRIANEDFIEEGTSSDMSMSFNSTPVWLGHICNYSIQLVFSNSPDGSFKLQCSQDAGYPTLIPPEQYAGVVNWTDIADSTQAVTADGDHTWQFMNSGDRWIRFVWTVDGENSGTLDSARFQIKGA